MTEKSRRGFAAMDEEKKRAIASKGGKAAHQKGTAHRFTSEEARAAGVQGVIILELRIATDGSVADAQVLRSIPMLDQAALGAVRQWRYTPTLLNGEPVELIATITINFRPE